MAYITDTRSQGHRFSSVGSVPRFSIVRGANPLLLTAGSQSPSILEGNLVIRRICLSSQIAAEFTTVITGLSTSAHPTQSRFSRT